MSHWHCDTSKYRGVAEIVDYGVEVVAKVYTRLVVSESSLTKMTMVFFVDQRASRAISAAASCFPV
jgi:hypothetical protein